MRGLKQLKLVLPLVVLGSITPALNSLYSAALFRISDTNNWSPLINLNHNGFHSWRVDHLTKIFNTLFPAFQFGERSIISIAVLFFGTLALIANLKRLKGDAITNRGIEGAVSLLNSLLSLSVVTTVILATGLDPVVFGYLAWIPGLAIIIARINSNERSSFFQLLILGLISCENALSANQLSILSAAAAFWLASLISKSSSKSSPWLVSCILLVPAIFSVFSAPLPEIPSYSRSAHVLPFETSTLEVRPLIGMAYPFEVLNRSAVRELYKGRAAILLIAALISLSILRVFNRQGEAPRYLAKIGLILGFLTILNTTLPEPWSTISPLPSLARLLPSGTSYSITSIAIGLGYWLLGLALVSSFSMVKALLISALGLSLSQVGSGELYHPLLHKVQSASSQNESKFERLVLSPSTAIFREVAKSGIDIEGWIKKTRDSSQLIFSDIQQLNPKIEVFPAPTRESLESAKKLEGTWRWSARTGRQTGEERITITFDQAQKISGIELDPGSFASDYPRGLEVSGGACDPEAAPLLATYPIWQGPLHVTAHGFPYYGPRNEVRIAFDDAVEVRCIYLKQTGRAKVDWSVSRIRVVFASGPD
jgi:hypothetical protein